MRRPLGATTLLMAVVLAGSMLSTPGADAQSVPAAATQDCESESYSGMVAVAELRIAYESFGTCDLETVLLIGGTGQQLIEWPMEFVQALQARGYRVVRFDNRDVGLSTHLTAAGHPDFTAIGAALEQGRAPVLPYTLRDMANDTVGLLDALGIKQAHLVGASMGGNIAQLVAIDYPDRVLSLTTIGADSANPALPVIANPGAFAAVPPVPAPGDREAFVEYQIASYRALASPAYPPSGEALREVAVRTSERAYDPAGLVRQQVVTLVDHLDPGSYRHANLGRIAAPAAIIQGADDPLQPLASAQELAAAIPDAELFVIPGVGHDLPPPLAPLFASAVDRAAHRSPGEASP